VKSFWIRDSAGKSLTRSREEKNRAAENFPGSRRLCHSQGQSPSGVPCGSAAVLCGFA
jgi:hypothetical protein